MAKLIHTLSAVLFAFCFSSCTAGGVNAPTLGAPVLPGFSPESVTEFEISMRPFSHAAWRVRLKRAADSHWQIAEHSDFPEGDDVADSLLIEHFLKVLTTFTAEAKADRGSDEAFGFTPYRVEMRLKSKTLADSREKETRLILGNPTGAAGIFFRQEAKAATYLGRGALVALLGHLQLPSAFHLKSAFLGNYDDYIQVYFEKHFGKDKGRWSFTREGENWRDHSGHKLTSTQSGLIERIFRQRTLNVATSPPPVLPIKSDWTLQIVSRNNERPRQKIEIYFALDQGFALNPQRGKLPVELYPEFAGALRFFTQASFTPVKSGTK